jgi:hypothetical protein
MNFNVINGKKKEKAICWAEKVGGGEGGGGIEDKSWSLARKGLERDVLSVLGFAILS